jgi:hypothetical protein
MTAVEFLLLELNKGFKDVKEFQEMATKALQKERQQIIDAWNAGFMEGYEDESPLVKPISEYNDAECYFNETFETE